MTPLRILLPLALLVAITLAEYPSSHQVKLYSKENDIELPNNPGIQSEDGKAGQPVESAKDKDTAGQPVVPEKPNVPDDNQPGDTKTDDKKTDDKKTDDKKTDDKKTDDKKTDDKKTDDKKTDDKKTDDKKTDDKKTDDKKTDDKKTDDKKTDDKKTDDKKPDNKQPDDKQPDDKKPDDKQPDDKKPDEKPTKPKEPDSYRLPENIKPKRYTIGLTVNQNDLSKADSKYTGSVSIEIVVEEKTNVIKLHYDIRSIKISNLELIEAGGKTSIEVKEKTKPDLDKSICELETTAALEAKKTYILTIKFEGTVNSNSNGFYKGSYFNEKGEKRWYAVTHFEPLGARSAFPCFDEPALKAEFSISITHSSGYTAISNMPSKTVNDKKVADSKEDWKETIFEVTPKMSTYLVAFAITDFDKTTSKPAVYSRKEVVEMGEYAATTGESVLEHLAEYTGIKFDLPKMDQIALPLLRPGAMENWGLVTYRETALLYDENVNATIDQQQVASIIAHEFAHQWFGNLVSPKWWSYIWLNEGFATYFQYYIADKINPDWRFMDQLNVACLQGKAFTHDADWTKTRPMHKEESNEKEIGDMFDAVAYQKAASVIRMFAHALGEDAFKKGIRSYLKENQGKAVTSEDLYKALNEAADKKTLPDGIDVAKIFGDWENKKGYPVITVTKNSKTKSITVKQEPFYLGEADKDAKDILWYVPLNYVQENDDPDFEDTSVQEWLTEDSIKISKNIEEGGWIIFNKQQTGYYRVNYDKENWMAIALYLQSENYTSIHPLNRAQLIDDALNLAYAGYLDYDIALNVLAYLEQERDYIVWKSAFATFTTLNRLLGSTEYYNGFSQYVTTITDALLSNLTYTEDGNSTYLTKLLRVDAIKWACDSGSTICRNQTSLEVEKWLSNPYENTTLSRDTGKVFLCGALKNATRDDWDRVLLKYVKSTNFEEKAMILSTLGCSQSEEILNYLLNQIIQPNSIFKGHTMDILQTVYSNSAAGVQLTLDFILANIDKLLTYDAHFYDNVEKYVNDLGSRVVLEEDVVKLRDIVAKQIIPAEKTKGALDTAKRNVEWSKKHSKTIDTWFLSYKGITEVPPEATTKDNGAGSLSLTTLLLAAPLLIARLR